jgi:hypothetical protein
MNFGQCPFRGMKLVKHEFLYEVSAKLYSELKAILKDVDALIRRLM